MFWALAADFLSAHCPAVTQLTTQDSGRGQREMDLFDSILHSWGSQVLTPMLLFSPKRNHRWKRAPLALSCATLREGKRIKLNCSSYLLQCVQSWICFCSVGVLEFLCWTPGLPKSSLICGWLSKSVLARGSWSSLRGTKLLYRPL